MPETTRRVQAIVDRFVADLTAVAQEEAARIVMGGFKGVGRAAGRSTIPSASGRGAKRSQESLGALQDKLLGFVRSHPGLRIEQINSELGTSTKDLALPIRKLVAAKKLRVQGQRRATKYFAGGNGSAKGGGKKRSKKK